MKARSASHIVVVSITNNEMLSRLRRAKTLLWDLPTGKYRLDVTGLGRALDTLTSCNTPTRIGR